MYTCTAEIMSIQIHLCGVDCQGAVFTGKKHAYSNTDIQLHTSIVQRCQ